jgi:hypothetical protein
MLDRRSGSDTVFMRTQFVRELKSQVPHARVFLRTSISLPARSTSPHLTLQAWVLVGKSDLKHALSTIFVRGIITIFIGILLHRFLIV